jgi:hypothetical protein
LGKSQPLSTQFPAFGFQTLHYQKTLQKIEMFPDGLLEGKVLVSGDVMVGGAGDWKI